MREIEVLVKVLESKKTALKKLSRFKKDKVVRILDKYYYHPSNKNMLRSKDKGFTEFFRLRRKGEKSYLTYKKDHFSKKEWLYSNEYELELNNPETMEKIIDMLKLKPLVKVDNTRTFYYYKNYEIVLEEVKNLGLFMEVERLHIKKENARVVRKEIFRLIKEIGVNVSSEMKAGKPELIYNKIHKLPIVDYTK